MRRAQLPDLIIEVWEMRIAQVRCQFLQACGLYVYCVKLPIQWKSGEESSLMQLPSSTASNNLTFLKLMLVIIIT
jgi:hypothetical protein